MALLVTNSGEIESLRNLLNANQAIPRNLILKLYTTDTYPAESDTPSQTRYFEPYIDGNVIGYGQAVTTDYPAVINNRTDQNYSDQRGILLNGNRWAITTESTAVTTVNGDGTTGTYLITVASNAGIKKGDYVTGGDVGTGAYVVDIDGTTLNLSVKNTGTFTAQALAFGAGRTTASYPEQTFTFGAAAGDIYGYYLARANNMPSTIHGVADAASCAAATTITKSGIRGQLGDSYFVLPAITNTTAATGTSGTFELAVTATTGVAIGQRVTGVGVASGTRVVGISGSVVYIDTALSGAVSNDVNFLSEVAADLTKGMVVSSNAGNAGPNGVDAATVIIGIDRETTEADGTVVVYLNNALIDNVQPTNNNDDIDFDFSEVTATAHGLVKGDVIYIDQGTGNAATTAGTYTIDTVEDANTFTTEPALDGAGDLTLYSSIFFAERFTNGPYSIQNDGDQIKVSLNVSLD
jgi:hypothetical protein